MHQVVGLVKALMTSRDIAFNSFMWPATSSFWLRLAQDVFYIHRLSAPSEPRSCSMCGHRVPGDDSHTTDWLIVTTGALPTCINCSCWR